MSHIFDSHSHYMPPEVAQNTAFFKVAWSDIDKHLSVMDDSGIEKALLLYPTSDAHLNMGWPALADHYNKSLSQVVEKHPTRFIGAAILPLNDASLLQGYLAKIKDMGFKVLSLPSSYKGKYLDDEMFLPVLEFAKEDGLLIHVHPQIINPIGEERVRDPLLTPVLEYVFDVSMCIGKLMMSGRLLEFSDVKVIFAHYGGVLPFVKERFENTYTMLRKRNFVKDLGQSPGEFFRNLYLDTSGSKSPASLLCALEVTDAAHILFGSDFPANQNISDSIAVIQNAPLSDEEKGLLLKSSVLQW